MIRVTLMPPDPQIAPDGTSGSSSLFPEAGAVSL